MESRDAQSSTTVKTSWKSAESPGNTVDGVGPMGAYPRAGAPGNRTTASDRWRKFSATVVNAQRLLSLRAWPSLGGADNGNVERRCTAPASVFVGQGSWPWFGE
ncbi:hypothetical protein GCM10010187_12820 [Actinomadura coerulea]|nr:hypothetical protein GCM10010187_12820 [Actinomadura coerulea]